MCTHYFSDDMLWWYFKQEWKNIWDHSHFNQFQMAASTVLIQQVPFSFSRYRSLAYILMSRHLLFKFSLPFSLARTYRRLVQPYRGFLRLYRYSKTFLRTFITHMHIQSLPRSLDAATIAENWSLTERRFRHLERTVLGRYLLSCPTLWRHGRLWWNHIIDYKDNDLKVKPTISSRYSSIYFYKQKPVLIGINSFWMMVILQFYEISTFDSTESNS